MIKSKSVETEIHTCNQIRYKIFTELQPVEEVMDTLLENNNPGNIEKMVIQPRSKIEEYSNSPGVIGNYDKPWVRNKPWKAHNRIG